MQRVRRSNRAVVILASPKTTGHSPKARFVVTMTEVRSQRRLMRWKIDLSVGTVGDAYDNALAECVIGLFKTEVINQIGPWKSRREVEWGTLKWVHWYNNRRLLGCIGHIPPAEAEGAFYANLNKIDMVA